MSLTSPYDLLVPWCKLEAHASQSDDERMASLQAPTIDRAKPISSAVLLSWCAQNGRLAKLEDAAQNAQLSVEVRSIAKAAYLMLTRDGTTLYPTTEHAGMVDVLVAAGLLSAAEKAELLAMATEKISQLQAWGLVFSLRMRHLAEARRLIAEGE